MKPRATNTGAVETYGRFAFVIATDDACNSRQMTGTAGDDHLYWSQRGGRWQATERLEDNLWLRMTVGSHDLGDKQHALERAAYRAVDSGN